MKIVCYKVLFKFVFILVLVTIFILPISNNSKINAVTTTQINPLYVSTLTLVFVEALGTIEDSFTEELKELEQYIFKYGLTPKKRVLIYLDTSPPYSDKSISDYLSDKKGRVKSLKVTRDDLVKIYGNPFLRSSRRVLIGLLVFPNINIAGAGNIKIYKINGFQTNAFQSILTPNNADNYEPYNRVYDRISMINYMNFKQSNEYIGMMEIFDSEFLTLTFMPFTGDKAQFEKNAEIKSLSQVVVEREQKNKDVTTNTNAQ